MGTLHPGLWARLGYLTRTRTYTFDYLHSERRFTFWLASASGALYPVVETHGLTNR